MQQWGFLVVLSLKDCRKLLESENQFTDTQIEVMRETCYQIANFAIDMAISNSALLTISANLIKPSAFKQTIATLPLEAQEIIEERASIIEFDGQVVRSEAEIQALTQYCEANFNEPGPTKQ